MVSDRVKGVELSRTLEIDAKVKFLIEKDKEIINLSVGEPDFNTPNNIKEAAIRSIRENFTRYTNSSGVVELREQIVAKLKRENKINCTAEQIVVSCGAKHSLINALLAVLNKGDRALIPVPYWTSYPEQVKICEAIPVFLKTDDFKLNAETFENSIDDRTKVLFLNSPNNPTGAVYSRKELQEIADVAIKNKIYVISDEIYEKLVYDEEHVSIASLNEEIKDLTITISGVSKTYAMTGWRIGYLAANKEIADAVTKIQSHMTSNPNSIAQKAALEALKGNQDEIIKMVKEFRKRRDLMFNRLKDIEKMKCKKPEGAFYTFPNVSELFDNKIKNSLDLSNFILDKAKVATVPGVAFGVDNYIRLSYTTSIEKINTAIDRIKSLLK